jgi:putative redox protein
MKIVATWNGRMGFDGTANTGFHVPMDASPGVGGDDSGFRPLELLAMGIAGCTGMDVISILRKKRQDVQDFVVEMNISQTDTVPYIFTHIDIHYRITGSDINESAVERAINLSATRYCPATAMMEKAVTIDHRFTITPGAASS